MTTTRSEFSGTTPDETPPPIAGQDLQSAPKENYIPVIMDAGLKDRRRNVNGVKADESSGATGEKGPLAIAGAESRPR
jgi:hypothetical protein